MRFAAFDVVVVPFPYSDRLAEKRRPALVVSADGLGADLGRVWLAMITSAVERPGLGDWVIQDLASAGLPSRSVLRASKIATLDCDRVLRRLGGLNAQDRHAARERLRECAAFSS